MNLLHQNVLEIALKTAELVLVTVYVQVVTEDSLLTQINCAHLVKLVVVLAILSLAIIPKQTVLDAIQDIILVIGILLISMTEIALTVYQDVFHVLDINLAILVH